MNRTHLSPLFLFLSLLAALLLSLSRAPIGGEGHQRRRVGDDTWQAIGDEPEVEAAHEEASRALPSLLWW